MSPMSAAFLSVFLCLPAAAPDRDGGGVRVSVVAVLATDQNDKIDPKLECIAREVRKLDPKWTGFRIAKMTCKSLPLGGKDEFDLGGGQTLRVAVEQKSDEEGRFQMKITPPRMGDITYTTTCGKFFPVVTPFRDKDNELLIIAVRIQTCAGK